MARALGFVFAAGLLATAGWAADIVTLTAAQNPYGLTLGPGGALYICEIDAHKITRLDLKTNQRSDFGSFFQQPYEIRFDPAGNAYVDDMPRHLIQRIDAKTKQVTTLAGPGEPAGLKQPHSIAFDPTGRLLICDIGNNRIRRLNLETQAIDTFALPPALKGPRAIGFDSSRNMYVVLREGNAVYRVDAATGSVSRFAGTGEKGYTGDNGPALEAKFNGPKGIACAPDGSVYIADTENHAIRRIDSHGAITTVAGTGERGDGPDGDPLHCKLSRPHGVFAGPGGLVYIGDSESNKVRLLRP